MKPAEWLPTLSALFLGAAIVALIKAVADLERATAQPARWIRVACAAYALHIGSAVVIWLLGWTS